MRTTLYTLNVENYSPEITKLTYPLLYRFARKIGAFFHVIDQRKFPALPVTMEKLQIYDLMLEHDDDWAWYIDSDALVHPDTFNVINHLGMDTVCHHGNDMAGNRWRYDDYFRRSQTKHFGSCNWCTIASRWCRDLWHPLDIPLDQALDNIFPIQHELNTIITREHLLDDYALSRNIARFGLRATTILAILRDLGLQGDGYFWHQYTMTIEQKLDGYDDPALVSPQNPTGHVEGLRDVLRRWRV